MVFSMAVIGAVTRLTESGLSITEWKPVTGALPPLNDAEWQRQFDLYRQTPEFSAKHGWMQIEDFRKIFFWEWLHRLWGRVSGLVFALPLLWFAARKQLPAGMGWKLTGILALGGVQGFIGWFMVQSGLVNQPAVSHFRLALHLDFALLLFGLLLWMALGLGKRKPATANNLPLIIPHACLSLVLLAITITWGAFTAGLDAGMIYNTFPLMNGSITPPESFTASAIVTQPAWVQFAHRWLAVTTGLLLLPLAWRMRYIPLGIMVFVQIGLGIATLLSQVPVPLAAAHQAGGIILLALTIAALHRVISEKQIQVGTGTGAAAGFSAA